MPFLALYITIVLLLSKNVLKGDERRYNDLAHNLTNGFFSLPEPHANLWSGPGYPLVLAPFKLFEIPQLAPRLLNAFFLFFAVVFFFKTLSLYINKEKALGFSILFGFYWPFFKPLPLMLTEIFTVFLITLFTYRICLLFRKERSGLIDQTFAAFLLTFIALTKPIFGYAILACLIIFSLVYMVRNSRNSKKAVSVFLAALIFCMPYLAYTYSLTHQVFYWASSGGLSLYTMSNPFAREYGDWFYSKVVPFQKHHKRFFDKVANLSQIERDAAFKKEAIKNIKNHPGKYLSNWFANIGRLLFAYPFSYASQSLRTYALIIPNMFIAVFSILLIYPTFIVRKKLPYEIILLMTFIAIYLFGSSLLSAYSRQGYITVPIIGLWIAYMISRFVKLEFRSREIAARPQQLQDRAQS